MVCGTAGCDGGIGWAPAPRISDIKIVDAAMMVAATRALLRMAFSLRKFGP
jgi:hypothetical protein